MTHCLVPFALSGFCPILAVIISPDMFETTWPGPQARSRNEFRRILLLIFGTLGLWDSCLRAFKRKVVTKKVWYFTASLKRLTQMSQDSTCLELIPHQCPGATEKAAWFCMCSPFLLGFTVIGDILILA